WCVGIQMTFKNQDGLDALQEIQRSFGETCSIQYTHILDEEYFPTKKFLQNQYERYLQEGRSTEPNSVDVRRYIDRVSKTNPQLAFIYYEVQKTSGYKADRWPNKLQRVF